jgi:hypothetical protein
VHESFQVFIIFSFNKGEIKERIEGTISRQIDVKAIWTGKRHHNVRDKPMGSSMATNFKVKTG